MLTYTSHSKVKPLVLVLLIVLLTSMIPEIAIAQRSYSCTLKLLAVNDSGKGMVAELELAVTRPGSGLMQFSSKIEEDTATSFKLALTYASIVTGVNYKCCNYVLNAPEDVKGLSATLAFYMFLVDLLEHDRCPEGYTATGIIGPGGIVGAVSGFREKLKAASEENLEIYAQTFQARNSAPVTMRIIQVYSIYDAYEALGEQLTGDLYAVENYVEIYQQAFLEPYRSLLTAVETTLSQVESVNWVDEYTNKSLQLLNIAKSVASKGKYYSASSIAFRALVQTYSSWLNYTLSTTGESAYLEEVRDVAKSALEETSRVVLEVRDEVKSQAERGYLDLELLDALSTTYMRAYEAITLFKVAEQEKTSLSTYATALARSSSAAAWLAVSRSLSTLNTTLDTSTLKASLTYIRDYWSTLRDYLVYMGLSAQVVNSATPIRDSLAEEYLTTLAHVHWLSSTLYSSETGLEVFAHNVTVNDVLILIELAERVLAWVHNLIGFVPVEPLLVLDLARTYLELGEDPATLVSLLYSVISKATIYALIARAIEWANTTPFTSLTNININVGKELALVIGAVFAATGALLTAIATKKSLSPREIK